MCPKMVENGFAGDSGDRLQWVLILEIPELMEIQF
jgi:hypothetical protein